MTRKNLTIVDFKSLKVQQATKQRALIIPEDPWNLKGWGQENQSRESSLIVMALTPNQ